MSLIRLESMERLSEDEIASKKVRAASSKATEKPNFRLPVQTAKRMDFPLKESVYRKLQDSKGKWEEIDIDVENTCLSASKPKIKSVKEASDRYSDEKVTMRELRGLADWLCSQFTFVYIDGLALYIYLDGRYLHFRYDFATRFLMSVFKEYGIAFPLRTSDYKEIVRLLQAQPEIVKKQEECQTDVSCVLYSDGVFVATEHGRMRRPCQTDYQFSKIDFPLMWDFEYKATLEARNFIERFCSYDEVRENYLWELIGYLLSSYQQKIVVVFSGPSNSGKSTLANMIRRICGTEACVAMGIKELSGNFSLAELQGKRLCIDSEMDATTLCAKDISLLKKVVGNDLLQGNRKHEQQFYFQCQTKFLLCTNNRLRFRSDEDTVSFFNRMKFFALKQSIPQDEQIFTMDRILDENRTYFLQQAMKGLLRLVSNNFQFSCAEAPEDFIENVSRQADTASVDMFVKNCCQCGEGYNETVSNLYDAYVQFSLDNDRNQVSRKVFSCHLVERYDVFRKRTSQCRSFQGIALMTGDK